MQPTNLKLIEELRRKMRKLDLFLINNVNPEILIELNGTNTRPFFAEQVHQIFVKTAAAINEIWQLELDLTDESDSEIILDLVLAELSKKLQNQPPKASAEALRCIEDIIALESKMVDALADDIKKTIKAEQTAEFYNSLIKPFKNVWVFIKDSIQHLVTSMILYFQVQGGVEFQRMQQSTHLPCVHKSVARSLDLLDDRNPKPTDPEEAKALEKRVVKEITQHIKKMELPANKKDYAFNTLERAKDDRAIEPYSDRTIMATLITIWIAAQDSAAYGANDSEADVQDRKNIIITHMALANREYNMDDNGVDLGGPSRPACLGGTVNKITESLELIHPDVRIIRGPAVLGDFCQGLFTDEFRKLNDNEQILLYSNKDGCNNELLQKIGIKMSEELDKINEAIFNGELSKEALQAYHTDNMIYYTIPETEAILRHKAELSDDNNPAPEQAAAEKPIIIVDGYEISNDDLSRFDAAFAQVKKLLRGASDIMIAQRCIKNVFDEELWDKGDNLQELAEKLLAQKHQISINEQATKSKEDINNDDDPESNRAHEMPKSL